jgi:hypothetical protein
VGLGTDPRELLLLSDTAVLHLGESHYILVAAEEDVWRATRVELGEAYHGSREIVRGIAPGAKVLTKGVILLKPAVMQSLAIEDESQTP